MCADRATESDWTRCVVLHHAFSAPSDAAKNLGRSTQDHFDLMIEDAASNQLITWALGTWPLDEHQVCVAEMLPNHRMAYLDYEGPVSGNRGTVRQVANGKGRIQVHSSSLVIAELALRDNSHCVESIRLRLDARDKTCTCEAKSKQ